ncbi:hypothetical protein ILUMI_24421 [Ignelater luminosus]|uniref:Uncharacterized protein n=1 Tax=Ignelater luminosus TaxID=2038154 RepID=A0A8K0C727_IGNLU|nr:hypothetical protein ILUMI_24421 [Ignelater luminosus]
MDGFTERNPSLSSRKPEATSIARVLALNRHKVTLPFSSALDKAATPANMKSRFLNTGTYPFNSDIFTEEDFLPSNVSGRPLLSAVLNPLSDAADAIAGPSGNSKQTKVTSEHIRPFPTAGARKFTRGRARYRCMITTETPEKTQLEIKKMSPSSVRRKILTSSSEEESISSSDEGSESDDEKAKEIQMGDYVLIKFPQKKGTLFNAGIRHTTLTVEDFVDYAVDLLLVAIKLNEYVQHVNSRNAIPDGPPPDDPL